MPLSNRVAILIDHWRQDIRYPADKHPILCYVYHVECTRTFMHMAELGRNDDEPTPFVAQTILAAFLHLLSDRV